jgi:hypothetical protein
VVPTLTAVAVHPKTLTVYFYGIEPGPDFGGGTPTFELGSYPLDSVLDTIRKLDPATEEYRIQDGLFAGETFCLLHDDGPQPVLGAYYRDNLSKPLTEYKGEINLLLLREGEALVDAAYAAFFPGDVLGLVRTSSKAPNFASIGNWLTLLGGYPCVLIALRDADTLAQLDDHPTGLRRLRMRIKRNRIAAVETHSPDVAKALRAAADVNSYSSEVGIEMGIGRLQNAASWSSLVRQEIEELMEILPEFEEAKVKVTGIDREINLLRANIQRPVEISIVGSKRVGPSEAAEALFGAYAQERASINQALAARRAR